MSADRAAPHVGLLATKGKCLRGSARRTAHACQWSCVCSGDQMWQRSCFAHLCWLAEPSRVQPALRCWHPTHRSPNTSLTSFLCPLAACTRSLIAWWTSTQCTRWRPLVSTALSLPACLLMHSELNPVLHCSRAACINVRLGVQTACHGVVCTAEVFAC